MLLPRFHQEIHPYDCFELVAAYLLAGEGHMAEWHGIDALDHDRFVHRHRVPQGVTERYDNLPLPVIGHGRPVAWSHTVNNIDLVDIWQERVLGIPPTTYEIDGQTRPIRPGSPVLSSRGSTRGEELY